MTTNEPPNQLEWFIRASSGVDSGQWDWGIIKRLISDLGLPWLTFYSHSRTKQPKAFHC